MAGAIAGNFAVVGLSMSRHQTFAGLALDENLSAKDAVARCGLHVIDVVTGNAVHCFRIEGWSRSSTTWWRWTSKTDEIRRTLRIGAPGEL